MHNIIKDRKVHIAIAFIIVFLLLGYRLYDLTIINGETYYEHSISNRIKKIETISKRGEIFDRNGNILATNEVGYTIKINTALIPSEDFNKIAIDLYDFFESQNEQHLEFPIYIENGQFYYRFDENIKTWLRDNGYDESWTAEMVFNDVRAANYIDSELSDYEAYRILYSQGKYMPISSSKMLFLDDLYKNDFIKIYKLTEEMTAAEAFNEIRNRTDFKISKDVSDEDAYKILVLRHALKLKGYLKYEPITVATSVSNQTAILVQEKGHEFPGLSVEYETIRNYPFKSAAAHILGYMGSISTEQEVDRYIKELGYNQNQLIGKSGIEGSFEEVLNGEVGYKYIEVDVYGKYVGEVDEELYGLDTKKSVAGEDIYLSIDLDLQQTMEASLAKALDKIKTGGIYDSPWGDYKYQAYKNVEIAAGVAVNVKTGEVLAMASYPSYDVNIFSNGISQDEWNSLNPVDKRNPLAARPLFNIASMMAVQPGSVYKMMTGYAAMEQGLDPFQKYYADGYIEIGNQRYGCWLWNDYGRKHGMIDFYKALEVSCNYYFYNVANGKDYFRNSPMNFNMSPMLLTESSKQFGLDEKTGIEISEVSLGLPDPSKKKKTIMALLNQELKRIAKEYFPAELISDEEKLNQLTQTIVGWSDENPSRGEIINRLIELGSSDDYYKTEALADKIKYDYFNLMKWYESDTLNLAIGQGDHTYTPLQIARYVATIANGGYLRPLTLLKVDGEPAEAEFIDEKNLIHHVQNAMLQVTTGSPTSITNMYKTLPLKVAAKTGTAQKEGLIPPLDEVAYLTEYLNDFAPKLKLEEVEAKTLEILKLRSEEMVQLEKEKNETLDQEEHDKKEAKLNELVERDYLNKGSAMREAIKLLAGESLTDDIINKYRLPYDNYSWFVAYAPFEDPEIAVVVMIPQGGQGAYSAPVARDIIAKYFNLTPPAKE